MRAKAIRIVSHLIADDCEQQILVAPDLDYELMKRRSGAYWGLRALVIGQSVAEGAA